MIGPVSTIAICQSQGLPALNHIAYFTTNGTIIYQMNTTLYSARSENGN